MTFSRRPSHVFVACTLLILVAGTMLGGASSVREGAAAPGWTGAPRSWDRVAAATVPEDRYAMAGGCYTLRAPGGQTIMRSGDEYVLGASAEPFRFQATDLGRYLLFDATKRFLAAREGPLAEAVYAVARSTPVAIAGGVALEQTDAAADAFARSPANVLRGSLIIAAQAPSELADWTVEQTGTGMFSFTLEAMGRSLADAPESSLALAPPGITRSFALEPAEGCAAYPEIEINIDGPVVGGETSFQEVRGYLEGHLHMMAYEFIGGRVRCGKPWHVYGVASALVDCPDHVANGAGAVLEQALSGFGPHTPDGWPSFTGWPRPGSLTHEQVYYKWLERAWRGGLRLMVNLLVDNRQLCQVYPFKRNSCNEMDGVRLQAERIRELERYIDAQSGGPGEGWFRIVTDPFQARRVINDGRLAVVLGIEVSVPLDCGITLDVVNCDPAKITKGLDEVYALGVRQMELGNKFDNAFAGITGDAGATGIVVNQGNFGETGRYWQMATCPEDAGDAHDHTQLNFHDESGAPDELSGRDAIFGAVLALFGTSGVAPVYPQGPHCNVRGLTDLGETMIRGMAERGMIFDPDHMSASARTEAMGLVAALGYSGVFSSHSWADDTIYPLVYRNGGVVTPHAGGSTGFVGKWQKHRAWADDRYFFGIGFGSDMNGFSAQGNPRGANAANKVEYPFIGFGGVTIDKQRSGTRTYDINTDGVAHYGLYPDWIEDLRRQAGDAIVEDLARGAEAYLQMWERAIGIAPDACRNDVEDLTDAQIAALAPGMRPEQVLESVGQPTVRTRTTFRYCMTANRTATVTFTANGALLTVDIA